MKTQKAGAALEHFQKQHQQYKQLIDEDIRAYSSEAAVRALRDYGVYSRVATDAYLDVLARGGKRMRGSLVLLGYEMAGGTDMDMVLQAARAVEMMQAYILIIDDIQDRSDVRRGGPAAHKILETYHQSQHLAGDSAHFGVSIALNAALGGAHEAQMILAQLDVDESVRLRALTIMNRTMLITAQGQTNDIVNEFIQTTDEQAVERVLEWKTAHYSLLNPLQLGMALADASDKTLDAITDYALHTGKTFQITDDILGTFGAEKQSGKSPQDDIREGKRTLLTVYALEHAEHADQNFLIQMLGNQDLSPSEFERCKEILVSSGALEHVRAEAKKHSKLAVAALHTQAHQWSQEGVLFLEGLATHLIGRTS